MATPIIEKIAVAIKTVLETITIAHGYEVDVAAVIRPNRTNTTFTPANLSIVMTQDDPLEVDPPQLRTTWDQPFLLDCYVITDEAAVAPVETTINLFRSDVERALMTLLSDDTFMGPLAENVTIRAPEGFFTPNGDYEGTRVVVDIQYRTLETNPYLKT